MSTKITLEHGNRILESFQDLEKYFEDGAKSSENRRIGIEFEALGVLRESFRAIRYTDHILPVFDHLIRSYGYGPILEEGRLIGLEKGERLVALEPGGQLELSGSPLKTLMECKEEHDAFLQEVSGHPLNREVGFLGAGLQPVSPSSSIETVPKPRYGIMAPYLSKKGSRSMDMMKRTATIQVNLDYTSTRDLLRKVGLCFRLTPVYQAMFGNSPIGLGRPNGYQTERAAIWQDTDPDRCGLVPSLMGEGASLHDYIDYVLEIPIILLEEDGRLLAAPPISFRSFLEDGIGGRRPRLSDFVLHLSLVFPEVRVKTFFEVRGADSLPKTLVLAPAAFLVGILYDELATQEAERLLETFPLETFLSLYRSVPRLGLEAGVGAASVLELSRVLLHSAKKGLERRGYGEEIFLEGLMELVDQRKNPAMLLRDRFFDCGKNLKEAFGLSFLM